MVQALEATLHTQQRQIQDLHAALVVASSSANAGQGAPRVDGDSCPTCQRPFEPSSPTAAGTKAYTMSEAWRDAVDREVRERMKAYATALDERLARAIATRVRRVTREHVEESVDRELQRTLQRAYYTKEHRDYRALHNLAERRTDLPNTAPVGSSHKAHTTTQATERPDGVVQSKETSLQRDTRHEARTAKHHHRYRGHSSSRREAGPSHATADELLADPLPPGIGALDAARAAAAMQRIPVDLTAGISAADAERFKKQRRAARKAAERAKARNVGEETPLSSKVAASYDEVDRRLAAMEQALATAVVSAAVECRINESLDASRPDADASH
jgi:hypothetical protein